MDCSSLTFSVYALDLDILSRMCDTDSCVASMVLVSGRVPLSPHSVVSELFVSDVVSVVLKSGDTRYCYVCVATICYHSVTSMSDLFVPLTLTSTFVSVMVTTSDGGVAVEAFSPSLILSDTMYNTYSKRLYFTTVARVKDSTGTEQVLIPDDSWKVMEEDWMADSTDGGN